MPQPAFSAASSSSGVDTSPSSFFGPKRFHPTPLALAELPPIEDAVMRR